MAMAEEPAGISVPEPSASHFAPSLEIGAGVWITTGHDEWDIKFGGFFFDGRSKLEWDDVDANLLILNAEAAVTPLIRIGGSIGSGSIDDGSSTDGDWLGDFQFSESTAETDGDVHYADIQVYYRFVEERNVVVDAFVGYIYYEDELNDKNGVQTLVDEQPTSEPLDGLDSSYSFQWQMAKLGVRADVDAAQSLSIRGSLAYLLLLDYSGEGFWNLRDDFKQEYPNFKHSSDTGSGVEGLLSARWKPHASVVIEGGYRVIYMQAEDGEDKTYFADGTVESTTLSNVESLRHGAFASVALAF